MKDSSLDDNLQKVLNEKTKEGRNLLKYDFNFLIYIVVFEREVKK